MEHSLSQVRGSPSREEKVHVGELPNSLQQHVRKMEGFRDQTQPNPRKRDPRAPAHSHTGSLVYGPTAEAVKFARINQ